MKYIWLLVLLLGCSGYRFSQQDNPLSQYGIESLSVPMFYNYSNLAAVSPEFTRETYRLLTSFAGLKLVSGYDESTDAVLIGIVKSPEKMIQTQRPQSLIDAQKKGNFGKRGNFYIPGGTNLNLYIQVIIIKKPSEEELALLKSGIGEQIAKSSRVIFNESITLQTAFAREYPNYTDPSDPNNNLGIQVVGTQNQGMLRKSVKDLASQAAISIRDTILYAF